MPTDFAVLTPLLADPETQTSETKEGPKTGERGDDKKLTLKQG